jgi:hypothetical protein
LVYKKLAWNFAEERGMLINITLVVVWKLMESTIAESQEVYLMMFAKV